MIERKNQAVQDEVEALNADVMRFMAILGLCLMLIFAAMEGLRVSSQTSEVIEQNIKHEMEQFKQNELSLENKFQQEKIQKEKLQKQIQTLLSLQQELQQEIEQKQESQKKLFIESRKQEEERIKEQQRILSLKEALDEAKSELNKMQERSVINEQAQQNKYLSAMKQVSLLSRQLKQKNKIIHVEQIAQEHVKPVKKPVKIKSKPKPVVKTKMIAKQVKQASKIESKKKGYVLRFSNDDAFVTLLKKQQIQLIFIASGINYKVEHQQSISTTPLQGDHQMYALNNETVPRVYKMALSKTQNEKWGVILPPQIRQNLQHLMRQNKSGVLEISSTGQVSINHN